MKKILSLCLVVVMLLVCFTACGKKLDNYAETLEEAGYEVEIVDEDEMEEYAENMGLDADEASAVGMVYAVKKSAIPKVILIVECESEKAAKRVAESADVIDNLAFLGLSLERDGTFVFIGSTSAVEEVLE